jgi:hypothetical protein
MRRGYFGGRVEVWRRRSRSGYAADVHSMYPWALASGKFPIEFLGIVRGRAARRAFGAGRPGIYEATIRVPESFTPPLPFRVKSGVAYPWGSLTGIWARPEIDHAIDCGCTIEQMHGGAIFGSERPIFAPWVDAMFDRRLRYGKRSREGKWLKLVLNSLTGKFGSKSLVRRIQLYPEPDAITLCTCRRGEDCGCGGSRPLDTIGRAFEQTITPPQIDGCAHVPWAAYLTAIARVKLHTALGPDVVYGDTDSIFREGTMPSGSLGSTLGTWDDLGPYSDMSILAPKVYRVQMKDGETIAAKGIPKPTWDSLAAGVPVSWESIVGVKRAGSGAFFRRVTQTRTVTPNVGRRIEDGPILTRAPSIKEIMP